MSEASFEAALSELRQTAPHAPEALRELVLAFPSGQPRSANRLRPATAIAVATALAVAIGAAVVGGLSGPARESTNASSAGGHRGGTMFEQDRTQSEQRLLVPKTSAGAYAPTLTAKARLQKHDVAMQLRVDDLSGATQRAVRTTRRLGGFVAGADYSTAAKEGNSRLALRVPVANLQKAIASFTQLGTILSQHISVADLQSGLDRLAARIAKARHAGHARAVSRLERRRDALIRE